MEEAEVVEQHKGQVHSIARKMRRTAVWDHEDMAQEGFIGLLDAARRHDPEKGALSTIAGWRIRGQIADAKRSIDPVPRSMHAKGMARLGQAEVSLQEHIHPGSDTEKHEVIVDSNAVDPGELVANEAMAEVVRELLDGLPERDQEVLRPYYYEGELLWQIAERLGVTESRVCQIHRKALEKLRARLR